MARALTLRGGRRLFEYYRGEREPACRVACENCGSLLHSTPRCTGRDDMVMGTTVPSANGEYRGPLKVRVLPPGASFMDRYARLPLAEIKVGQFWANADGRIHVLERVRGRSLFLYPHRSRGMVVRITRSTLLRDWRCVKEAPRG